MPYCSNCGKSVGRGARFCENCGARLDVGEQREPIRGSNRTAGSVRESAKIRRTCAFCDGTGQVKGPLGMPIRHLRCNGKGWNLIPEDYQLCEKCDGSGKEYYQFGVAPEAVRECTKCRGTGWAP